MLGKRQSCPTLIETTMMRVVQSATCSVIGLTIGLTIELWTVPALSSLTPLKPEETVLVVLKHTCESVNEAIAGLPNSGGTVLLTEGDYLCSTPILVTRSYIRLLGAGMNKTLLRSERGAAFPTVYVGSQDQTPLYQVELGGFSVTGGFDGSSPDPSRECFDLRTSKPEACTDSRDIRNDGLQLRRVDSPKLHDIRVEHSFANGIEILDSSKNVYINGLISARNALNGMAGREGSGSSFLNLTLNENGLSGLSVNEGFAQNKFLQLHASSNGDNGVFSNGASNSFEGSRFEKNKGFGFWIDSARVSATGAEVPGSCDHQRISQTSIRDNGRAGVRVNGSCRVIELADISIRTGDPGIECLSLAQGAQVKRTGLFDCETR